MIQDFTQNGTMGQDDSPGLQGLFHIIEKGHVLVTKFQASLCYKKKNSSQLESLRNKIKLLYEVTPM